MLRAINEKIASRGRTINLAFLDLKAAFDSVPRVEIWNTLEKWGISEKLLRVIKSTYEKGWMEKSQKPSKWRWE